MIELQINPPDIDREYLECLNAAFGYWGETRQFKWYFRRETIFPATDILVFRENGKPAAGSGITYRRVRLPDEKEIEVGIMTGSWTLPQFRGKGFFAKIIEESRRQAARKNAKLLLAFVTADNASFRQLQKSGAILFPSFYIFSNESTPIPKTFSQFEKVKPNKKAVTEIFKKLTNAGTGFARFVYPAPEDFRAQFLQRTHETEILSNDKGDYAVIEKKNATNIVQYFLSLNTDNFAALLAETLGEKRKFFAFTMQREIAGLGEDFGLEIKKGFLTVLPVDMNIQISRKIKWKIQGGDRA